MSNHNNNGNLQESHQLKIVGQAQEDQLISVVELYTNQNTSDISSKDIKSKHSQDFNQYKQGNTRTIPKLILHFQPVHMLQIAFKVTRRLPTTYLKFINRKQTKLVD